MAEGADAVVVGAGPAGAAFAIFLARRGFEVALLDKARFPRDKACGEGVLPHGVAVLAELGLEQTLLDAGAQRFRGLKYWTRDGANAEGDFPEVPGLRHGLVMRRQQMDHIVLEAARAEPRIRVLEGARVVGLVRGVVPGGGEGTVGVRAELGPMREKVEVRAPLTIGADGLHSKVREWLGARGARLAPQRWGVRAHLRGVRGLADRVEVVLAEHGEVYLTRCSSDDALVALLLDRAAMAEFRGLRPEAFLAYLRRSAVLRKRFADAAPPTDVLAAGPLGSSATEPIAPGAMLVGDSAGALDPITAEGIALALRGAKLASETAAAALSAGDLRGQALEPYSHALRRERRDLARVTDLVLQLCRNRHLAARAVRTLDRCPELFQRLLLVTVGIAPYRSIRARDKLRFVLGL